MHVNPLSILNGGITMKAVSTVRTRVDLNTANLQPVAALTLFAATVACSILLAFQGYHILGFSLIIGAGLGFAFQRSRFCLTAAFRDFLLFRSTEITKAVFLLLILANIGFVIIYFYSYMNNSALSVQTRSVGIHTAFGAVLFGAGAVIAGGCVTGMLMRVGEGYIQQYGTLLGLLAGSLAGAWHRSFWNVFIDNAPRFFLPDMFGWPLAIVIQFGLLFAIYLRLHYIETASIKITPFRFTIPKPNFRSFYREVWTYNTGAITIAALSTILYYYRDKPFGVTTGVTYWGAWLFTKLGGSVSGWAYFQGCKAEIVRSNSFLFTTESLLNAGFVIGALISALGASESRLRKARSAKHFFVSMCGGIMMGYGARVTQGCNIGAGLSAISAFSLQGWVFGIFAYLGAYIGTRIIIRIFNP
jgi:hypothetical protein